MIPTRRPAWNDEGNGESGAVAPAAAAVLAIVIAMVGLVTDVSVWFSARRNLQAMTDSAALAGATALADNFPGGTPEEEAKASLATQGLPSGFVDQTQVQVGFYCPDSTIPAAARFGSATCPNSPAGYNVEADAVRVTAQTQAPTIFSRLVVPGLANRPIQAVATAARINQAAMEIGGGLLDIDTQQAAPVINALLSGLLGTSISLEAVQYDALAETHVATLAFLDALATKVDLEAGVYDDLLDSKVSVGEVLDAAIDVLETQGEVAGVDAAIDALTELQAKVAGAPQLTVGDLVDLGIWRELPIGHADDSPAALDAGISAFQLLTASLQLANGDHAINIPNVGVTIPGLAALNVTATIGEPAAGAYFGFGPEGTTAHSAATRLKLDLTLGGIAGLVGGASVPLYLEVGVGDAEITRISCGGNPATDAKVYVDATSDLTRLYIGAPPAGTMENFSHPVAYSDLTPAYLKVDPLGLGLNLLTVAVKSQFEVGAISDAHPWFVQPQSGEAVGGDIGQIGGSGTPPIPARVSSDDLTSSLLGSLVQRLQVNTCVAGLICTGSATTIVLNLVGAILSPVFSLLDPVLDALLAALGVQVGTVDVWITGVRCGWPVLVE